MQFKLSFSKDRSKERKLKKSKDKKRNQNCSEKKQERKNSLTQIRNSTTKLIKKKKKLNPNRTPINQKYSAY